MSKYNKVAEDPRVTPMIRAWYEKRPPIIYFYGPTGVGKTHLIGTLLKHRTSDGARPYSKVLYIDGDNGSETVAEAADNEDLCIMRAYEGKYDGKLNWFFDELKKAETTECEAIVVEGFNALFKSMLTPAMRKLSKVEGTEAWQAHNDPAQKMDTIFEAVKELSENRKYYKRPVPIFGTFNVREVDKIQGDSKSGKQFVPNFSPNRIRAAMGTSQAFIELQRESALSMLCRPDSYNKFRKLRRTNVASQVEAATNLSLPGLLALWAIEYNKTYNKLSAEITELVASSNEPQPSDPEQ